MAQQQLSDFKNTDPGLGNVRFAYNTSNLITGLTISTDDCSGNSRVESISNLNSITIGSATVNTVNGEAYSGYYYYDVSPTVATSSVESYSTCTTSTLDPAPSIDTFRNSNYNAEFNNAIEPRRIQRTGSFASDQSGVFVIDRKNNQIEPSNLDSIISGSAVTASFQESNLYSKAWTSGRYDGAKLTSGSLYLNEPALSFKSFEAARFSLFESSSLIRSTSLSDLNIETFYFNPPFKTIRTGLVSYFQGSIIEQPPANQPVYELVDKDFKRLTRSKLYIPNIDEIVNIYDYRATYEPRPFSGGLNDNVFHLEMQTLSTTGDTIRYYTGSAAASLQSLFIRPGDAEEIIVSASFVTSTGEYSTDAIDETGLRTPPNVQPWQSDLGRQKTYVSRIVSSSRNIP